MYQPKFRKKNNNIPILTKAEIDEIAEGFVLDFCPEAMCIPQPINVDLFIEKYLGLTLDYQYLSNDARYLGMTVFNDTSKIIVFLPKECRADYYYASAGTVIIDNTLTKEDQLNRYRYTCGHEAGHWIFHRSYYNHDPNQLSLFEVDTPYIKCRELFPEDFSRELRAWDDEKWMEWHADKFSSCFLMPRTAVLKITESKMVTGDNEMEIIMLISRTFKVSYEAAAYRLMELGIIRSNDYDGQLSFI